MSRPAARVLAMLEALQSGGTHTVGELAGRLEVDERTVRRYVGHLLDLGVPVETVRGRYGGYRLGPGYRMPPLMLTDDEALATVLGLVAGRRTGLVDSSSPAADRAIAKLRRVLPPPLARRLEALLQTTSFTAPAATAPSPETQVLLTFAGAARDHRPVAVTYTGRDGHRSERTVLPYGIVAHHGRWYVTGSDSASGEVRTFRLDRVTRPRALDGSFEPPADFDPAAHVVTALAATPWAHPVSLRIQGPEEQIRSRLPATMATVEPLEDGWFRVELRAERLDWVPGVLAALDRPFVIEHPAELCDLVLALAGRLTAAAGPPTSSRSAG